MRVPRRWIPLAVIALAACCAQPAWAANPPTDVSVTPNSPGNTRSPSFSFKGDPLELPDTYQCQVAGPDDLVMEDWTDCTSPHQYTIPTDAPDGTYTFSVHATVAGQQSPDATATYTLDTTGPTVTIDSGPTGEISDPFTSFSFTAGAESVATSCRLSRDGAVVFDWDSCTSPWAYGLSTLPDGNYEFAVRATDELGNIGEPATRAFTVSRPQPPQAPAQTPQEPATVALRPGICLNLFNGTPGADRLSGSQFGDVLIGFAGNDRLAGMDGGDCVLGDQGNDHVDGGPGNDDVRGEGGNDLARGSMGNDSVTGGSGRDVVDGGAGNDMLIGGPGRDRIIGGPGKDTIKAADGKRDAVNCGSGRDTVTADRIDRLISCEKKHLRGRKR